MKVIITTPRYRHNLQMHELDGEACHLICQNRYVIDWLEMFLYIFQVMQAGLQILAFG